MIERKKRIRLDLCKCGCNLPVKKNRSFTNSKCYYRYQKRLIEIGELPPDYYAKCLICGRWFPCWFFLNGYRTIPRKCNDPICKKSKVPAQTVKKIESIIQENYQLKQKQAIEQYGYDSKKINKICAIYCNGRKKEEPQCANYCKCLDAILTTGLIFLKYFETKGTCYQYPKTYQGIRYDDTTI